jgi:hypothetical protein
MTAASATDRRVRCRVKRRRSLGAFFLSQIMRILIVEDEPKTLMLP